MLNGIDFVECVYHFRSQQKYQKRSEEILTYISPLHRSILYIFCKYTYQLNMKLIIEEKSWIEN